MFPQAAVGFLGLERDEQTAIARSYYQKLPKIFADSEVFILDPMLATGGSFDDTVCEVKKKGGKNIRLVCIVAAPEGIERIKKSHPDVKIYTAAIDDHLNDKKYIVPGLGDFGDRYFGTVEL
jgi:uracil phosphoribosyltransferase